MKKSNNPSVIRSQQWLYNSLIMLMKENPFDSITIGEITKNADLDRTTFYRNFDSKEDILNVGISKIKNKYMDVLKNTQSLNMEFLSLAFFKICYEEINLLRLLHSQGLSFLLLNQFNEILPQLHISVKNKFNYQISEEHLIFALYFNTGGFFNILMKWMEGGFEESTQELVESFIEITKFNVSK
ncbi:TetR/AcrR family transcriptional regulator [Macrococcus armenti]|uniref:TetR/AcrR family transcriptional regulator n=1 Tax=Macrococcus armenti TaxID=2875764 RepID=A0ABY3ZSV1_9STAP|nr:TetR/AcrR family transcriptional regulator [Macrococcus armenti]UOB19567.1 TetR/AcrR family transcriptional regulator [Macrococcus armenti]